MYKVLLLDSYVRPYIGYECRQIHCGDRAKPTQMEPAHFKRRVFVRKCDRRVDERRGRAASSTAFIDGLLPVSIRCVATTPEPRWLCHELLPNVRQPASLLEWVDGHDLPPRVAAIAIENAVVTGRAGMHRPFVHESHPTRLGIDVTNAKAAVLTLGDGKPVANCMIFDLVGESSRVKGFVDCVLPSISQVHVVVQASRGGQLAQSGR